MNLNGWDVAFAASFDLANAQLADPSKRIDTFTFSKDGFSLNGKFGAWRLSSGGALTLLHLDLDVASGTLTRTDGTDVALDGSTFRVEVNLAFLPTSPTIQSLGLNLKVAVDTNGASGPGVVKPLNVIKANPAMSFADKAVTLAGLAEFLVSNASAIAFRLADINLVSPAADTWLAPKEFAYSAYKSTAADLIVIFSKVVTTDVSALTVNVDPTLVAGTGNAFFGISEEMFVEHVILPAMPDIYKGTTAATYKYQPSPAAVVLAPGQSIALDGVKSGAITYYPVVTALNYTVSGSTIVCSVSGSCDLKMGMSMTFSVSSTSQSTLDAATGKISFAKDPKPVQNHESHIPWYDYLIGPIPDIVMAIVVPIVADGIASGLNSQLSGSDIASAGPLQVTWPGMSKFKINTGGLNSGLQLAGTVS